MVRESMRVRRYHLRQPDGRDEEIVALREKGLSTTEIAELVHMTNPGVGFALRRLGREDLLSKEFSRQIRRRKMLERCKGGARCGRRGR